MGELEDGRLEAAALHYVTFEHIGEATVVYAQSTGAAWADALLGRG
jgi:hypothetical protein